MNSTQLEAAKLHIFARNLVYWVRNAHKSKTCRDVNALHVAWCNHESLMDWTTKPVENRIVLAVSVILLKHATTRSAWSFRVSYVGRALDFFTPEEQSKLLGILQDWYDI